MSRKFNWKLAELKNNAVGWQTLEGEWSSKEHPLLDAPSKPSLDPPMFFWPTGIIRYRFIKGSESFFEFCRQDTDKFVGPFSTMHRAQQAFEGDLNG
ncbi:MAG: hypothetical protein CL581_03645 [Alteromonadaceae bacterium]|nr:hypothetical protein [Alteromonadaceae bacterium]